MKVFLSYSSTDAAVARRLALDLRSANLDVWLDQWEVGVGDKFEQSIERGLDEAEFVIVLLTRASVASEWVDREWRHKVQDETQKGRVTVVPVRSEPCEMPDFLAQRSYADISGGSYPLGFRHLLEILRYYSDGAAIKVPESTLVAEDPVLTMLPVVTPITLEVGRDLIPIFEQDGASTARFLDELAPGMRNALQAQFGFPFPGIRVRGNDTDMPPRLVLVMIDEIPEIWFEVGLDDVLVNETVEGLAALGIRGEPQDDPAGGGPFTRIAGVDRIAARAAGLTTWDAGEYIFFVLQQVIRGMASLFLDIDVTRRLVDTVEPTEPKLIAETVPKSVSWYELTEIFMRLVDEEVSIGDVRRILRALSQSDSDVRDTVLLAERVRHALSGQITAQFMQGRAALSVILLDPEIEALFSSAIQRTTTGAYLALEPQITQDVLIAIRERLRLLGPGAGDAPILTEVEIRHYIRKLVELRVPVAPRPVAPGPRAGHTDPGGCPHPSRPHPAPCNAYPLRSTSMSIQESTRRTRVLLSFSSAYDHLARRLTHDLQSANIDVRYDKWEGGGGAPAVHAIADGLDGVAFVLPLLTPSDAARTWIGDEWRRAIYNEALARGIDVLPVRGEGDQTVVPNFLRDRSFADLYRRDYALELRRLVEAIRNRSGDPTIVLPDRGPEAESDRSPIPLPANPFVLEVEEEVAPLFVGDDGTSTFDEMLLMMRDGLFYELGVPFPGPVLRTGSDVPPSSVRVVINDVPETLVEVRPDWVMVNDRVTAMAERGFVAQPAVNPATDAPTAWIPAHSADAAKGYGLTTWDAHEFMILSLSALLRRKAAAFVGIDEARTMLERIRPVFPHLVAETVPRTVPFLLFTDVLRRLVAEQVSIGNLRRILMALADLGTRGARSTLFNRVRARRFKAPDHAPSQPGPQRTHRLAPPSQDRNLNPPIHPAHGDRLLRRP